jgi:UDP-N-acetylmuramyl tripeptide synthase
LALLANQLEGIVVIAGTNGKTTTSRLVSSYFEGAQRPLVHNRSGSNLTRGILSALLAESDWYGRLPRHWGLFEVDEAALPKLLGSISPDYVVALNLFRDQLDRYGEVDAIATRWQAALSALPDSSTVILNADDPKIAFLGAGLRATVHYFGLDYATSESDIAAFADSRFCPRCGQPLHFERVYYSHLGVFQCPSCGFRRPTPDVSATDISLHGMQGSAFTMRTSQSAVPLEFKVAGLFNIYNVTAAMAVGILLGFDTQQMATRTRHFEAVFGRLEKVTVDGTEIVLVLVKNPTGFNQVVQTLTSDKDATDFWFILNDKLADGRDVSWIWDVQLDRLMAQAQSAVVSGTRAFDMGLRLKYAGFSEESVHILPKIGDGLRLTASSRHQRIYCLCTYTGMLDARRLLQSRQAVRSYHAN